MNRQSQLSIVRQCQLLELPRSTFYYAPKPESNEDLTLKRLIDQCYMAFPYYGTRRVRLWLKDEHGLTVNRKKIQRLRREMGIETLYPKRCLSQPGKGHRIFPYLLKGLHVNRSNQVWAADITYVPMKKGFVYLVAILDWYSRRVLSWKVSTTMDADFCVTALNEAIETHGTPEIFNTDQGSQFTGTEFSGTLLAHNIKISMDGKGRWIDNVFVERLWRSVKYEEVYLRAYDSVADARCSLKQYFEHYNTKRRHQGLGNLTPDEVYFKNVECA